MRARRRAAPVRLAATASSSVLATAICDTLSQNLARGAMGRTGVPVRKRLLVAATALGLAFATPAMAEPPTPGEAALQARLIAPCCWNQTLDIHESEIATELRAEIHARLAGGEKSATIEDDLARRFGARIRAVPPGRDVRGDLSIGVGIAALLFGGLLVMMVRGWIRRAPKVEPLPPATRTEEDARLDDELRAMER